MYLVEEKKHKFYVKSSDIKMQTQKSEFSDGCRPSTCSFSSHLSHLSFRTCLACPRLLARGTRAIPLNSKHPSSWTRLTKGMDRALLPQRMARVDQGDQDPQNLPEYRLARANWARSKSGILN